jgi:hypothetical protein
MTFNFPLLVGAMVLLWLPRQWMRNGRVFWRVRRRSRVVEPWNEREDGDPRLSWSGEFSKLRNYLDLFRGGIGSLALCGGMGIAPAIVPAANAGPHVARQVLMLRAAVLLVGLLIQTARWQKRHLSFYPPIFYLAGLSIGLCDIRGAAFAFVLMWAFNAVVPSALGFLSIYAVLLIVFGHFFAGGGDLPSLYAGLLCLLPVVFSLLTGRPLLVQSRKSPRAA